MVLISPCRDFFGGTEAGESGFIVPGPASQAAELLGTGGPSAHMIEQTEKTSEPDGRRQRSRKKRQDHWIRGLKSDYEGIY